MAIDYVTVPEMKVYLGIKSESQFDTHLEEAISSASRELDRRTKRYFGVDTVASPRKFKAYAGVLFVDDISTLTGITVVDASDNAIEDYEAYPLNGVVGGQPNYPRTRLEHDAFYAGDFYTVTAKWGWPAVPAIAKEVCKLMASDNFLAKDVPHGVKGVDEFGVVRIRERQMIEKKINQLCREPVAFR